MNSYTVERIPNGKWRENCYIYHNSCGEALIVDPGSDSNLMRKYIESNRLSPLAILNTHAHYDHVGAVEELKKYFNIPFYLHGKDRRLLRSANLYKMIFDGEVTIPIPEIDFVLDELVLPITLGSISINVVHTPGHTKGSVCFLIGDCLFTGDTLLKGKVGRTDLPGGNPTHLYDSLYRLTTLAPEIVIYPGHGSSTTIEAELNQILNKVAAINES